jgi:hypothetical protein
MENFERGLGIYKEWIWGLLHCVQYHFWCFKIGSFQVLEHGITGVFCYNIPLDGHLARVHNTMKLPLHTHRDPHAMSCARKNDILTPLQPHSCSCSEMHFSPHAGCVRLPHVTGSTLALSTWRTTPPTQYARATLHRDPTSAARNTVHGLNFSPHAKIFSEVLHKTRPFGSSRPKSRARVKRNFNSPELQIRRPSSGLDRSMSLLAIVVEQGGRATLACRCTVTFVARALRSWGPSFPVIAQTKHHGQKT